MASKLICFDMDGVIFRDSNFWMELHKKYGTFEKGKELTEKYLHTDYPRLIEEVVVKLWKGKDASIYYDFVNSIQYTKGAWEVLRKAKKNGYTIAIISGGSIDLAKRIQNDYGADYIFANALGIADGKISGEFSWPVGAGTEAKAKIIEKLCSDLKIKPKEAIYVGDSKADIHAFKFVGTSIAFNSSCRELKECATHVVDSDNLSDVLKYI